jgi:hypothetical protein
MGYESDPLRKPFAQRGIERIALIGMIGGSRRLKAVGRCGVISGAGLSNEQSPG